jgi:hypothetical protein
MTTTTNVLVVLGSMSANVESLEHADLLVKTPETLAIEYVHSHRHFP